MTSRLARAGCIAPQEEAAELLAAAPDGDTLERWIQRREQGEPLAWITGTATFGGLTIRVDPGVYVPRFHSEELARRASELLPAGGRAVDLCTGAGAIAAYLQRAVPSVHVAGVDIDRRAVVCTLRNGVAAVNADLDGALRGRTFDVVTAVAPYVPSSEIRLLPADVQRYEPRLALDGGADGLDLVRRVVWAASRLLRPGGWLLTEVGGDQDRALAPTLEAAGFEEPTSWFDPEGDLRGLVARRYAQRVQRRGPHHA
jgi:release factor glutamine methyltransferase